LKLNVPEFESESGKPDEEHQNFHKWNGKDLSLGRDEIVEDSGKPKKFQENQGVKKPGQTNAPKDGGVDESGNF